MYENYRTESKIK